MDKKYSLPYVIRPKKGILLSFVFEFLIVIGIALLAYPSHLSSFGTPLAVLFLYSLNVFVIKIVIDEDKVSYKNWVSGSKEMSFSEIKRLKVDISSTNKRIFNLPMLKYNLEIYNALKDAPLIISLDFFYWRDLLFLINTITEKVPSVEMDEYVKNIKDENYGPLIEEKKKQFRRFMAKTLKIGMILCAIVCATVYVVVISH